MTPDQFVNIVMLGAGSIVVGVLTWAVLQVVNLKDRTTALQTSHTDVERRVSVTEEDIKRANTAVGLVQNGLLVLEERTANILTIVNEIKAMIK